MRSKPTRATRHIHAAADRVEKSKVSVDWDSSMSTVEIGPDIFMQGDDADSFIAEIDALTKRFPSLDDYTAALALSEPYLDCIGA